MNNNMLNSQLLYIIKHIIRKTIKVYQIVLSCLKISARHTVFFFVNNPQISLLQISVLLCYNLILSDPCRFLYSYPSLSGSYYTLQFSIFLFECYFFHHIKLLSLLDFCVLVYYVLSSYLFRIENFFIAVVLIR